MLLMQHHQDGLMRRLSVIGIPTYTIKPFVGMLVKWENCSGVEWTIKRLKSLKIDLFRSKAGLPTQSWVRKNSKGEFAGTIGSLFRWALSSDRGFRRCVQAFMAYTYYILPDLSEVQKKKFLSGINPERTDDGLDQSFIRDFSNTVRRTVRKRSITCCARPLVTYQGSPGKKAPRLYGQKSIPQNDKVLDDLQFFNTDGGLRLYTKFKELYKPLILGLRKRQDYLEWISGNNHFPQPDFPIVGGEIHFLQEPGGKLRSVASPLRIHQEALRPLGEEIYRLVRSLPWDCTFDQSKAIPHIQSCLRQGCQVHSIDLSSATDLFPLSLQVAALKAVFRKEFWVHIDLFEQISRGIWNSKIGWLQWSKGQPLGLFPSFGTFTLTHGLLLRHLAGPYKNQFFVLGDDVVILNDKLRDDYISMLDRMGCPWSEDKSLSSNKLSEFAGKVITSNEVLPQLKWRRLSDDNFLDICRLLGARSRCLLSERQKVVFDAVAHLCDPIGLNFSLPGDNLEKMIKRTLAFYRPIETVLGSLMGLRKRINTHVYSLADEDFDSDELESYSATFDEKVKDAMRKTVFTNWEVLLSIGPDGFSSLPQALGLEPRLPLRESNPTRVTTLERYERFLNHRGPLH